LCLKEEKLFRQAKPILEKCIRGPVSTMGLLMAQIAYRFERLFVLRVTGISSAPSSAKALAKNIKDLNALSNSQLKGLRGTIQ
jgi:hypothetical protein